MGRARPVRPDSGGDVGEDVVQGDDALDAAGLERLLDRIRPRGHSGDVYARLVDPG